MAGSNLEEVETPLSLRVVLLLHASSFCAQLRRHGSATRPLLRPPAPIECAQCVLDKRVPCVSRVLHRCGRRLHLCSLGIVRITCLLRQVLPGALESPGEDV